MDLLPARKLFMVMVVHCQVQVHMARTAVWSLAGNKTMVQVK